MNLRTSIRPAALALPLAVALMGAGAASAGQIVDLATESENLLAKDEGVAAYDKLRDALRAASDKIPFTIRRAFFVTEKPLTFGSYKRVENNEFPTGTSLTTYVEPLGLGWKAIDGGNVESQFTVDFVLKNPGGEILAEQKAFGNFKVASREPLYEIYTPLTLDVSAVPAGAYVLVYTFTDGNTGKTTSIEQRFTLK